MAALDNSITLDDTMLRYRDLPGNEPAVVFLHGAGADHVMFDHQISAIAATGRRVIALDLRGHGRSRPSGSTLNAALLCADVLALTANLTLDKPVLAGHSLGGNLGQALVRQHPERFSGLVVMGSTWNTGPLTAIERLLLRLAGPSLALIPARRLPRIMARASATTEFAKIDAERAFGQLTKAEFLAAWRATVEFVAPNPSYRTPVPLLLIRGELDRTGNIAAAMPQWAAAEGVAEHVVPGAGHLVTQDSPEVVTETLLDYLEKHWPLPST
ncbi:alpha/beta fold hydrolase [Humidisolicoccus flavus]|uniref:alpha/beta fold hydrolase n=1 Tax=Humidisolicoccus flavus TaxID=3111414 RepID=UPI0032453F8D